VASWSGRLARGDLLQRRGDRRDGQPRLALIREESEESTPRPRASRGHPNRALPAGSRGRSSGGLRGPTPSANRSRPQGFRPLRAGLSSDKAQRRMAHSSRTSVCEGDLGRLVCQGRRRGHARGFWGASWRFRERFMWWDRAGPRSWRRGSAPWHDAGSRDNADRIGAAERGFGGGDGQARRLRVHVPGRAADTGGTPTRAGASSRRLGAREKRSARPSASMRRELLHSPSGHAPRRERRERLVLARQLLEVLRRDRGDGAPGGPASFQVKLRSVAAPHSGRPPILAGGDELASCHEAGSWVRLVTLIPKTRAAVKMGRRQARPRSR